MPNIEVIKSTELPASAKLPELLRIHSVTPERLHTACSRVGGYNARKISLLEVRGYLKKGFFPMGYYGVLAGLLKVDICTEDDHDFVDVLNAVSQEKGGEVPVRFIERMTNGLKDAEVPKKGYVGEWLLIVMHTGGYSLDEMARKMDTYPAVVKAITEGKVLIGKHSLLRLMSPTMGYMQGAVEALEERYKKDCERFKNVPGALGILSVELGKVKSSTEFLHIYSSLLKEHAGHFKLKEAAELNELPLENLRNALKNYNKRGATSHASSAAAIANLHNMAKAMACDVNSKEKYEWVASILTDIGLKKLPRNSLDALVEEFFAKEAEIDSSAATDDRVKIKMQSKKLAAELGEKVRKDWQLGSKQHFLRDAGFGAMAEKASVGFFKMGSEAVGFSQDRLNMFRNPDGTPINPATRLELQALVNGNPTIPLAKDVVYEARQLLNGLMSDGTEPQNNFVAAWMRHLHHKHPEGKFLDEEGKLNKYRVTNAVLDILMERYAFDLKKTWPAYFRYINPICKGERDVCIFPDSRSHRESPYMALVLAEPFRHDRKLHDDLALLFLMITERKEPECLLEEKVLGIITTAEMHKILRLQAFQEIKSYAYDVCKLMDISNAEFEHTHLRLANMLSRLEGEQGCTDEERYAAALARRWFPVNGTLAGKSTRLREAAQLAFLGKPINRGEDVVTLDDLKTYIDDSVVDHSKTWAGFVAMMQKYLQCETYKDVEKKSKGLIAAYRVKPWLNGVHLHKDIDADIFSWLNKTLSVVANPKLKNALQHLACNTRKYVSEEAIEIIESQEEFTPEQSSELLFHLRKVTKMHIWQIEEGSGLRTCEYRPIENSGVVAVFKRHSNELDRERSDAALTGLARTLLHDLYPNRDILVYKMEAKLRSLQISPKEMAVEASHGIG